MIKVPWLLLTGAALSLAIAGSSTAQNLQRAYAGTQPPLSEGERLLKPMHIDIKLSAAGQVTAVRPDPAIPSSIAVLLERAVRSWQYRPAKRNDQAIDWATRVTLWLTAVPVEKGVALRVSRVTTDSVWLPETGTLAAPRYPGTGRRDTEVLALAEPAPDSRALNVISMWVNGEVPDPGNPFARVTRDTLQRWKLDVLEWDGKTYPTQVCIPVWYSLNRDSEAPAADAEDEAGNGRCDKMPGAKPDVGITLVSKVVGSML